MVVIIASTLRRSRTIPIIPTITEAGIQEITSSPPRAAIGLPQPGRRIVIAAMVRIPMTSNVSAIFPNRI
ncbi:MAG: hypothetical protein ACYS3N_23350 [Planctomycetota bacterium]